MGRFNPSSTHPQRAVQAWQILVGKAMNRQTVTYRALSELMYGKPAAGVLGEILGHIAFYCIDSKLPALTSIVVNTGGTPGSRIPIDLSTIDTERESVYDHDWYDVYPPNEDALSESFKKKR